MSIDPRQIFVARVVEILGNKDRGPRDSASLLADWLKPELEVDEDSVEFAVFGSTRLSYQAYVTVKIPVGLVTQGWILTDSND